MSLLSVAIFASLGVAFLLFGVRMLIGPTLSDRVVALDGLIWTAAAVLVARSVETGDGFFLPVVVLLTLIAFIGTAIIARFIEGRDP